MTKKNRLGFRKRRPGGRTQLWWIGDLAPGEMKWIERHELRKRREEHTMMDLRAWRRGEYDEE